MNHPKNWTNISIAGAMEPKNRIELLTATVDSSGESAAKGGTSRKNIASEILSARVTNVP